MELSMLIQAPSNLPIILRISSQYWMFLDHHRPWWKPSRDELCQWLPDPRFKWTVPKQLHQGKQMTSKKKPSWCCIFVNLANLDFSYSVYIWQVCVWQRTEWGESLVHWLWHYSPCCSHCTRNVITARFQSSDTPGKGFSAAFYTSMYSI